MNAYLKTLGLHVYLTTTKKSYLENDKYIEANTQASESLRHTLGKEHLYIVSYCDFAFVVWNTLTSHKEQASNNLERESP